MGLPDSTAGSGGGTRGGSSWTARDRVLGVDHPVPLLDGSETTYVNLDNASTTPPFRDVFDELARFLPYYSSVHRGTGFKSRLSTAVYDDARRAIASFVNADPDSSTVVFGKNTTEAVNKLAHRFGFGQSDVVLTTLMEHHSNMLPWMRRVQVVAVGVTPEGRLDEQELDRRLEELGERVALVAVTGASNVTGFIQPIHRIAEKAHSVGAMIFLDGAQLAPHRSIDVRPDSDPGHIDFVALSAHKMYAPFGAGALIGPRKFFEKGAPEYTGGGTVRTVTLRDVDWADPPERDEAGSPNVPGALAMAAAARVLTELGLDRIAAHEESLVSRALEGLGSIPGVRVHGEADPSRTSDRVGVIPFELEGTDHALLAAIAGYEGGIGVRNGLFCAHPYVCRLLGLSGERIARWRGSAAAGDGSDMPGLVRMSLGCYSDESDVRRLLDMVARVAEGDYRGSYEKSRATGEYYPGDYAERFGEYYRLSGLPPSTPG